MDPPTTDPDPAPTAPRPPPPIITFLQSLPPWLLRPLIPAVIAAVRLYILLIRARLALAQVYVLYLRLLLALHRACRALVVGLDALVRAQRASPVAGLLVEVCCCACSVYGSFRVAQLGLWVARRGLMYCVGVWEMESLSSDGDW